MLPETINPHASLLESDSPQVNLVRWMHQCELIKRYYEADYVFVVQRVSLGFEVLVSAIASLPHFTSGQMFDRDTPLFLDLVNALPDGVSLDLSKYHAGDLPTDFDSCLGLLARPILWPDGSIFGCLCVLSHKRVENQTINSLMLEPFQILLQQDLALLCQSHRVESLSMRDRETGMLNHYGFIMMAPRQLNLGRRFGAHAGILFFELQQQSPDADLNEKHHRLLGGIIQHTIRTADIAAHYSDTLFVVLAFLDNERDLNHIVQRVERQLAQQEPTIKLDYSFRFFSPDSGSKLGPMLMLAKENLQSWQQEQKAKAAELQLATLTQ
ncbi:GGDEF domain-containing protein [Shewanella sp. FJAT-52076]|uniref:GGDEF domain-containing protein n=1 Tax=Shewanella sp. FJAT-52076 TaxID=2864202 RepID=UPI001C660332|nr:GGDEF domain-containing protein [Shewanella sp. FJAT-52076]QYJ77275.1 GGDEF domain-containing protein [Shewanella sp. FJAT-52076]